MSNATLAAVTASASVALATYSVSVDWDRLDALIEKVVEFDFEGRRGGIGLNLRPERTLRSLASVYATATACRERAWHLAHDLRIPRDRTADDVAWCWVIVDNGSGGFVRDARNGRLLTFATRAGAERSRKRRIDGASLTTAKIWDEEEIARKREARIARLTALARRYVALVLAIGDLCAELARIFGGDANAVICGTDADGCVAIQGPSWWAGERLDEGRHSRQKLAAFAAGAGVEVFAPETR